MNYAVYVDRKSEDGCFDLAGTFFECDNTTVPGSEHLAHEFAALLEYDYGLATYITQLNGRTDFASRIHPTRFELRMDRVRWLPENVEKFCEWCLSEADEERAALKNLNSAVR